MRQSWMYIHRIRSSLAGAIRPPNRTDDLAKGHEGQDSAVTGSLGLHKSRSITKAQGVRVRCPDKGILLWGGPQNHQSEPGSLPLWTSTHEATYIYIYHIYIYHIYIYISYIYANTIKRGKPRKSIRLFELKFIVKFSS